jgi:hypothetical protein
MRWLPVLGLIGIVIGFGCLVGFCAWWARPRGEIVRPWLTLLVLLVGYGLIGGLALGLLFAFCALVIAGFVGWIPNDLLRGLAGASIGVIVSSWSVWYRYRMRAKAVSRLSHTEEARLDPTSAPGTTTDQGGIKGIRSDPTAAADRPRE